MLYVALPTNTKKCIQKIIWSHLQHPSFTKRLTACVKHEGSMLDVHQVCRHVSQCVNKCSKNFVKRQSHVVPLLRTELSLLLHAVVDDGMVSVAVHTTADSQCFSMSHTIPKNFPFSWRSKPLPNTRLLGPRESVPQMASRSVNNRHTNRQRDHGTRMCDICSNMPHLCYA